MPVHATYGNRGCIVTLAFSCKELLSLSSTQNNPYPAKETNVYQSFFCTASHPRAYYFFHTHTTTPPDPTMSTNPATPPSPHPYIVTIELQTITTFPDQTIPLPPTDRGIAAWRLFLAAFIFEALIWGFPLSFSVF
jgi:hypothetical protein